MIECVWPLPHLSPLSGIPLASRELFYLAVGIAAPCPGHSLIFPDQTGSVSRHRDPRRGRANTARRSFGSPKCQDVFKQRGFNSLGCSERGSALDLGCFRGSGTQWSRDPAAGVFSPREGHEGTSLTSSRGGNRLFPAGTGSFPWQALSRAQGALAEPGRAGSVPAQLGAEPRGQRRWG